MNQWYVWGQEVYQAGLEVSQMSYKEKIELIKKKISGKILFNENL